MPSTSLNYVLLVQDSRRGGRGRASTHPHPRRAAESRAYAPSTTQRRRRAFLTVRQPGRPWMSSNEKEEKCPSTSSAAAANNELHGHRVTSEQHCCTRAARSRRRALAPPAAFFAARSPGRVRPLPARDPGRPRRRRLRPPMQALARGCAAAAAAAPRAAATRRRAPLRVPCASSSAVETDPESGYVSDDLPTPQVRESIQRASHALCYGAWSPGQRPAEQAARRRRARPTGIRRETAARGAWRVARRGQPGAGGGAAPNGTTTPSSESEPFQRAASKGAARHFGGEGGRA